MYANNWGCISGLQLDLGLYSRAAVKQAEALLVVIGRAYSFWLLYSHGLITNCITANI